MNTGNNEVVWWGCWATVGPSLKHAGDYKLSYSFSAESTILASRRTVPETARANHSDRGYLQRFRLKTLAMMLP